MVAIRGESTLSERARFNAILGYAVVLHSLIMLEFHWRQIDRYGWSLLCNDVKKWQQFFLFLPCDCFCHNQTIWHIRQSLQQPQRSSDRCVRPYEQQKRTSLQTDCMADRPRG